MGDYSYEDEIWCCMAFCAQVEGIGVGDGCDCIFIIDMFSVQATYSLYIVYTPSPCMCPRKSADLSVIQLLGRIFGV